MRILRKRSWPNAPWESWKSRSQDELLGILRLRICFRVAKADAPLRMTSGKRVAHEPALFRSLAGQELVLGFCQRDYAQPALADQWRFGEELVSFYFGERHGFRNRLAGFD